ncbi:MAG: prohibitin family protein [Verrucomicrobia bacterium]|nr:prohibitin family protein [Verrucomicrobiota bacterium]
MRLPVIDLTPKPQLLQNPLGKGEGTILPGNLRHGPFVADHAPGPVARCLAARYRARSAPAAVSRVFRHAHRPRHPGPLRAGPRRTAPSTGNPRRVDCRSAVERRHGSRPTLDPLRKQGIRHDPCKEAGAAGDILRKLQIGAVESAALIPPVPHLPRWPGRILYLLHIMNPGKLIGFGIIIVVAVLALAQATYVVDPGFRGVLVTLGKVSDEAKPEGFGTKSPFISHLVRVPVRQLSQALPAECYSSDLQQVNVMLRVLYRIPESQVVNIYKNYAGDPFDSLVAPRLQEALKEVTALQSAEQIVRRREEVKNRTLAGAKEKVGGLLVIEDLVIENITLSKELEAAIEAKMVQEQEAAKSRFTQQKTQIEAETAIIRAKGEAEAIRIRGEALRDTPGLIQLQIVEKWDGKAPLVIGGGDSSGTNFILPLNNLPTNPAAAPAARRP